MDIKDLTNVEIELVKEVFNSIKREVENGRILKRHFRVSLFLICEYACIWAPLKNKSIPLML